MNQYFSIKAQYKGYIVLFRMGDFYETFYEDAQQLSQDLQITLTKRDNMPLAGIPYHALDTYLPKLINKGRRVAICEQVEDPKHAKGIVKREVVRLVTPGTAIESSILQDKASNYLCAVHIGSDSNRTVGLSICDFSTGDFFTTQFPLPRLAEELDYFSPVEIIMAESAKGATPKSKHNIIYVDDRFFWEKNAEDTIKETFGVVTLKGFDLEGRPLAIVSSGALLMYLKETQRGSVRNISKISYYEKQNYLIIDPATRRNLELERTASGDKLNTLLFILDQTITSMGSRKVHKLLQLPLRDMAEINKRLDSVAALMGSRSAYGDLRIALQSVYDMERIMTRIAYGRAIPREVLALAMSIRALKAVSLSVSSIVPVTRNHSYLLELGTFPDLTPLAELIETGVSGEEGELIHTGYNPELDTYRALMNDGRGWMLQYEQKERKRTGIKSLKVRFTKVFGYFIDVTRANLSNVPPDYTRRQTTLNSERYITAELKEMEDKLLNAEERFLELEKKLYAELLEKISKHTPQAQEAADKVSMLDCLHAFASLAITNSYCRPEMHTGYELSIEDGRHPVVERLTRFVPNDTNLGEDAKIMLITGPNMAGKSTILRQVALITLMAHIGSFVPAKKAKVPLTDRIFTRIGASDDISKGTSTFLAEMSEVAYILNNATPESLIILDEIGRGTSTYDGLSIAWAVVEHIYRRLGAKTMFATHYHQLNAIEEEFEGVKNFNVAVKEVGDEIIFMHKLVHGGTDRSYGIYVSKLAGLPADVIARATEIMHTFGGEKQIGIAMEKKEKQRTLDEYMAEFGEPPTPGEKKAGEAALSKETEKQKQ